MKVTTTKVMNLRELDGMSSWFLIRRLFIRHQVFLLYLALVCISLAGLVSSAR